MSAERSSGSESHALSRVLIGFIIGTTIANIVHSALDDTEARVLGVQINNEQLYNQLSPEHSVQGLILNDGNHTYSFHSRDPEGQPEVCNGKYDVAHNFAHVAGPLACTQTITVKQ